ncbi:MAG: hypothetical protein Q8Q20_03050 [bacterium]|nr:hypothetical protein [bacterium]
MRVKVQQTRSVPTVRLLPQTRYCCPWCWAVFLEPGRCTCGAKLEKERRHIVFQYEGE